jgi:hypothetical protein
MKDTQHMPYKDKAAFIKRGYTVAEEDHSHTIKLNMKNIKT